MPTGLEGQGPRGGRQAGQLAGQQVEHLTWWMLCCLFLLKQTQAVFQGTGETRHSLRKSEKEGFREATCPSLSSSHPACHVSVVNLVLNLGVRGLRWIWLIVGLESQCMANLNKETTGSAGNRPLYIFDHDTYDLLCICLSVFPCRCDRSPDKK